MVFTTFPEPPFSAADVLEWHRLRWRVELGFKRFKSLAQLGHVPEVRRRQRQGVALRETVRGAARGEAESTTPARVPPGATTCRRSWRDFKFVLNQVARTIEPPLPLTRRSVTGERSPASWRSRRAADSRNISAYFGWTELPEDHATSTSY